MSVLRRKKCSWLSCTALCLLLSCSQQGTIISSDPVIIPQQGTMGQAGDLDTSLHKAILKKKDIDFIRTLLKDIPVNTSGNQGNTPLHLAARQGSLELVALLIEE